MKPTYIIAEIGINHNGDLNIAKRLIDIAAVAGCDAVKFQKRNPDVCVPEHQKGVMRETPWGTMTYLDYKYKVEFEKEEYDEIDSYCREKGIAWSASPWDLDSLNFLNQYDLPFIKIPSAMLTNDELLKAAVNTGKKIILSVGMSTEEEIDNEVEILKYFEFVKLEIKLLICPFGVNE
jgi:N-acetylneuraminate synthase